RGEPGGERLDIALEHEAEVLDRPDHHEPFAPPLPLEYDRGRTAARVPADRALGERGALDAGARHTEAVGEVPQGASHRPPAAAHRAAAHARLAPVRRFLVDHQVE